MKKEMVEEKSPTFSDEKGNGSFSSNGVLWYLPSKWDKVQRSLWGSNNSPKPMNSTMSTKPVGKEEMNIVSFLSKNVTS